MVYSIRDFLNDQGIRPQLVSPVFVEGTDDDKRLNEAWVSRLGYLLRSLDQKPFPYTAPEYDGNFRQFGSFQGRSNFTIEAVRLGIFFIDEDEEVQWTVYGLWLKAVWQMRWRVQVEEISRNRS